jgi:hypothetical protein
MTFEKQCLIEASDFISVRYECAKCHAAIVVPIEKLDSDQAASFALRGCTFCDTASGFQDRTPEMDAFLQFNVFLKKFIELSRGRNLRMRFGIKCAD